MQSQVNILHIIYFSIFNRKRVLPLRFAVVLHNRKCLSRRGGRERSVGSSVSPANFGLRHWIPHKNML
jgi:hypothetical protein